MHLNIKKQLLIITILASISFAVHSQTVESFDNINTLESDGWIFDNRSDFPTKVFWAQGIESLFPAQSGTETSYIFNTTASGGELVCNWLIMPDIGNIEQLSFYTRSQNTTDEVTRMLVMYSPTGSINTGNCINAPAKRNNSKGLSNFGDFQQLLSINQNQDIGGYPQNWTEYTVDVNGTGRIAFLYYVETGAPNFNSGTLAIDSINLGTDPVITPPQMIPTLNFYGLILLLLIVMSMTIKSIKQFTAHARAK